MNNIEATGSIKNGELKIFNRKSFLDGIANLSNGTYVVSIKKKFRKRSIFQNAYYWGVVIPCFVNGYKETSGESIGSDIAHAFLKQEFNSSELINENTGEIKKIGKSTTSLTTTDFMVYIDECNKFIEEWFGIRVPLPEEQSKIEF